MIVPIRNTFYKNFLKTVRKPVFGNIEIEYEGAGYYKSNITNWKKIIKDEFSNTKGISIKYYGYNEMATITLVNKDLFPIHNNRRR